MNTYKKPSWSNKQIVRETGLVEDICKHGVGHPNKEFLNENSIFKSKGFGVHGCDGCCCEENYKKKSFISSLNIENKPKEEMKIITVDRKSGMLMIDILEQKPICSFCGENITERNFGGIFSKPIRVCCDNICCINEAIPFEE